MSEIEERLKHRNLVIPSPVASVANYVGAVRVNDLLYVSGQLPFEDRVVRYRGVVGLEVQLDTARKAAELCMLNILGHVKASTGSLDAIERCVRVCGFVLSEKGFADHANVVDGASDLLTYLLGDRGKHVRVSVGCSSLPLGAAVEVEGLFLLKPLKPA